MKGRNFDSYREIVEVGIENDMPLAGKLVLVGMMWNDSGAGGTLTHQEFERLEAMLRLPKEVDVEEALEYALAGSPDVAPPDDEDYAQVAS